MTFDFEQILKIIVIIALVFYVITASTVFEVEYPHKLIELYTHPWWRLLLVILIIFAWRWSPLVGILVAAVVFFYLHDMYILLSKDK